MSRGRRVTTQTIIKMLRGVEIHHGQGQTIASSCWAFGITEQTYYRWRRQYGGMQLN